MADLRGFSRELVGQMEKDLGTRLDWVAVDHWNTQQPHVHTIVRGVADDDRDLVISRDYINEGMCARAQNLVTQELGLRSDLGIHHAVERQVEGERWTQLDRHLVRDVDRHGAAEIRRAAGQAPQVQANKSSDALPALLSILDLRPMDPGPMARGAAVLLC